MAEPSAAPNFSLIVPAGAWNAAALCDAVRLHHPDASITAVWCGDPHRRPVLPPGASWCDVGLIEPLGIGWGLLLAALPQRAYEWARMAASVRLVLRSVDGPIVVLRLGSVAVLGDCSPMLGGSAVSLVGRGPLPIADDGLSPTDLDLLREGGVSPAMASFGRGSEEALLWLARRLLDSGDHVGPLLERMGALFGASIVTDPRIGAGPWRPATDSPPSVLDLDHLDQHEPWHFTVGARPTRVRLSGDPLLASAVAEGRLQAIGERAAVVLPGGIPIDAAVRTVVRDEIRRALGSASAAGGWELPAEPFGPANSRFVEWLESSPAGSAELGRYWTALHSIRPDLAAVFVDVKGVDLGRYRAWTRGGWKVEALSALVDSYRGPSTSIVDAGRDPSGVNVLGYLGVDQSLGAVARRIIDAIDAAGIPVARLEHRRAMESERVTDEVWDTEARFSTNICVINADQFEFVVADHGATLLRDRHTIAYWFWELEHVPERFLDAIDHVDEIWTGSRFVADAFAAVTSKPVHCVPLPVTAPQPSNRDRASMGLPDDAFVFVTTFDQFSVPERKNPFGSIDAFTRAFAEGEGPVLLIKTVNGERGWRNHERLLLAASRRSDIIVWDEHLSRADQMAVLANADCLVSLHRSEGLGLHCAEAMWLGKPVIATRYSGNLDFMDDTVAAMIDFTYTTVTNGEGIYPDTAVWADPDLDQAAAWMRRLVIEPRLGADLGARARQRMEAQPSLADTGRLIARLAYLVPNSQASR